MGARARDLYYMLAAYAVTLPAVWIARPAEPSADLIAWLKLACIAAFAWHVTAFLRKRPRKSSSLALAITSGLVWAAMVVIIVYRHTTMMPFIFGIVVLSIDDARRTLVQVLGEHGVALTITALIALTSTAIGATWTALRALPMLAARLPAAIGGAVVSVAVLCYFAAGDLWYVVNELVLYPPAYLNEHAAFARARFVPDYAAVPVRSNDSVIIVQLESVTSFAVFAPAGDGEHFRARIPQPGLESVVKEGGAVLFPLFWANGTQTHRAWESILCSVSGNLGVPLVFDRSRLLGLTCLPSHLARAGFATLFFYSYFDLDFYDFGGFAKMAGFQDIVYGPRLMLDGDRRHQWAYDDCVFYDRAFDYLKRTGLDKRERLFAYFEVGMHHSPFFNSSKYPDAHPHRVALTALEAYQNSLAEQDHCLRQFWKRFQELDRDDVHLFILPDHGIYGMFEEPDAVFATWLAYVPPKRRIREFRPRTVTSPTPSQAQLYPTLLQLLGGNTLPASFAFALRGEPAPAEYRDCQLLAEPMSERIIAWRNGERAEFHVRTKEIVASSGERRRSDFSTFTGQFACK